MARNSVKTSKVLCEKFYEIFLIVYVLREIFYVEWNLLKCWIFWGNPTCPKQALTNENVEFLLLAWINATKNFWKENILPQFFHFQALQSTRNSRTNAHSCAAVYFLLFCYILLLSLTSLKDGKCRKSTIWSRRLTKFLKGKYKD